MIEIGEAQQKLPEEIPILGRERIHVLESLGRVLYQDVMAIRDVPSSNNSAMDGYCLRHEDVVGATSSRPVRPTPIGGSPAGRAFKGKVAPYLIFRYQASRVRGDIQTACGSAVARGRFFRGLLLPEGQKRHTLFLVQRTGRGT